MQTVIDRSGDTHTSCFVVAFRRFCNALSGVVVVFVLAC